MKNSQESVTTELWPGYFSLRLLRFITNFKREDGKNVRLGEERLTSESKVLDKIGKEHASSFVSLKRNPELLNGVREN